MCGDFSALPDPIYDPTSQVSTAGSYSRTQFGRHRYPTNTSLDRPRHMRHQAPQAANVIPQGELSPIAKYLQQYWAGANYLNSALTNNYRVRITGD